MKPVKQLIFVFVVLSFFFVTVTPVFAGSKAGAKKTKQEKKVQIKAQKKLQTDKAKHYKAVQKPAFKNQLAQSSQALKQARADVKNNEKLLKKAKDEEKIFEESAKASKKLLDAQKDKLDKAERKYLLESTDKTKEKNQANFESLKKRYTKAQSDYESGPKKRWQDKVVARETVENNLAQSKTDYTDKIAGAARITAEKILAKQAIKDKTIPAVSIGEYQSIPKLQNNGELPAEKPVVYDRAMPAKNIEYSQLPNQPVNNYSSSGLQLKK